jgi:hypothetical protein
MEDGTNRGKDVRDKAEFRTVTVAVAVAVAVAAAPECRTERLGFKFNRRTELSELR